MSKINNNVHVYADQQYAVWTGPLGTATPTTLPPTPPGGMYEAGLLSDAGITEAHNFNENKIYDLAGALVRIARNQEERPFTFECLESNAVVSGLLYVGSTLTTTAATAEVQTVTLGGTTATGGTFNLILTGIGAATGLAYNISATSLAAALSSAFGMTVTCTLSGGVYTVNFPAGEGNVPLMTSVNNLTPAGATITVATTTPGVQGVNSRGVGSGIARNLRAFAIDLVDGSVHKRICINSGEALQSGTVTYSGSAAAVYQFTCQPYKDSNGLYYTILDDDPAQGGAFV